VARTLSRQGYLVIVPDLNRGGAATDAALVDAGEAAALLDLSLAWLRSQEQTSKSRIAVMGLGSGGRLAQNLAMRSGDLNALVMIESPPRVDAAGLASLRVPLLAHFAAEDEIVDVQSADQLRRGLEAAGKQGRVYVYQGAHHGFMNEARDQYHPDAARLAWARTLAFLQSELKGGE
jgi:carboxymethylenebutenolidase